MENIRSASHKMQMSIFVPDSVCLDVHASYKLPRESRPTTCGVAPLTPFSTYNVIGRLFKVER
jgi:hypothetical protein